MRRMSDVRPSGMEGIRTYRRCKGSQTTTSPPGALEVETRKRPSRTSRGSQREPVGGAGRKEKAKSAVGAARAERWGGGAERWGGSAGRNRPHGLAKCPMSPRRAGAWRARMRRRKARPEMRRRNVAQAAEARARSTGSSRWRKISTSISSGRAGAADGEAILPPWEVVGGVGEWIVSLRWRGEFSEYAIKFALLSGYTTQFVLLSEYAIGARISFVPCPSVSSVRSAIVFSARRRRRQSAIARAGARVSRAGVRPSPASSILVGVHPCHPPSSSSSSTVWRGRRGRESATARADVRPSPASSILVGVHPHRPPSSLSLSTLCRGRGGRESATARAGARVSRAGVRPSPASSILVVHRHRRRRPRCGMGVEGGSSPPPAPASVRRRHRPSSLASILIVHRHRRRRPRCAVGTEGGSPPPPAPVSAAQASIRHRHRPSLSSTVIVVVVHGVPWARREGVRHRPR
ncbi:Os10g0135833 [Oryza sativa Japonica Group]|uniref:Os10g0135833 protein n=1 Tax=Oryza sativa subsp. japonica TaxID=39947 RepID=A0A0P0XRU6_ORYSJ|nr:Os10g0135833 [Oryza sativa Japonica Group]